MIQGFIELISEDISWQWDWSDSVFGVVQCQSIHAVSFPSGRGSVIKDVPQMGVAPWAVNLTPKKEKTS
jgi:hypothetical protein